MIQCDIISAKLCNLFLLHYLYSATEIGYVRSLRHGFIPLARLKLGMPWAVVCSSKAKWIDLQLPSFDGSYSRLLGVIYRYNFRLQHPLSRISEEYVEALLDGKMNIKVNEGKGKCNALKLILCRLSTLLARNCVLDFVRVPLLELRLFHFWNYYKLFSYSTFTTANKHCICSTSRMAVICIS